MAQHSIAAEMRAVTPEELKYVLAADEDDAADDDDVAAAVEQLKRSLSQAASKRGLTNEEKAIAEMVDDAGARAAPRFSSGAALDIDDDRVSWLTDDGPVEVHSDDDDPVEALSSGDIERPPPRATCATRVLDRVWTNLRWWRGLAPVAAPPEPQE